MKRLTKMTLYCIDMQNKWEGVQITNSQIAYIIWYVFTIIVFIIILPTTYATEIYFIWVMSFNGIMSFILFYRILNAAHKNDPKHYDNIRYYFLNSRVESKLYSSVPEIQRRINEYLSVKCFSVASIILLIIGEVIINFF